LAAAYAEDVARGPDSETRRVAYLRRIADAPQATGPGAADFEALRARALAALGNAPKAVAALDATPAASAAAGPALRRVLEARAGGAPVDAAEAQRLADTGGVGALLDAAGELIAKGDHADALDLVAKRLGEGRSDPRLWTLALAAASADATSASIE